MQRIVAGGTGLIGTQLINHWLKEGHAITVIGRSKEKIQKLFKNQVKQVEWQALHPDMFQHAEIVVNLTGAGIAEKRWSRARKNEILHSRIDATKKLIDLLQALNHEAPPLFNASAIGIYGLQKQNTNGGLPAELDENTPINWDHPPDFLSQVGCAWEKASQTVNQSSVRVVNLRFGVVLARQGGALPQIVRPFDFFMGGRIGTGQQAFSWIAIDDLIEAIDFLMEIKDLTGPINMVAPNCVTQYELAQTIGHLLHKPYFVSTPSFILKLIFGKMGNELLLEGQNVYPTRLINLGFRFTYPDIKSALTHILSSK